MWTVVLYDRYVCGLWYCMTGMYVCELWYCIILYSMYVDSGNYKNHGCTLYVLSI